MQALKAALTSFLSSGDKSSDDKLLSLQGSPEFWELSCQYILEPGSPESHFFVLNMLYRKVPVHTLSLCQKKEKAQYHILNGWEGQSQMTTGSSQVRAEWNKTDLTLQSAVTQTIAGKLESFSPLLMRRACLVLAAGATSTPEACEVSVSTLSQPVHRWWGPHLTMNPDWGSDAGVYSAEFFLSTAKEPPSNQP